MEGDRRSPGAIILGGETDYFFRLPSSACPADWSRTFRRVRLWNVYEMACFQGSELLRQPLPSSTSLRRRYDVAASIPPVVVAPVILDCRDLLHSALASGHLCQVRAARHCSFLDSVLELLTDVHAVSGEQEARGRVLRDGSVAGARRTPGRFILEASSLTSSPATLSSPLPPLLPRVANFVMDWAAVGRKSLLRRDLRRSIVSFPLVLAGARLRHQRLSRAGVRLRYQRLLALRRPFHRLLRHRSAWVVGTCCTRPWCQGACVRSEQLATVPSWTVCLSCSPATHRVWGAKKQRVGRDGCVAGDRRTPGRTSTGGELLYFLRQPHASPLCLRWPPGFRTP